MNLRSVLTTVALNFFFILCVPSSAYAGSWTVPLVQDNSNVSFIIIFSNGSSANRFLLGVSREVILTVSPQDNVAAVITIVVRPDGTRSILVLNVSIPNSLPSLEPFEVPNFIVPGSTLTSTIDLNAFLAERNPFTVGQTFSVINGITPLADAIVFTDQFGNPFSGTATVDSFHHVDPVPEPTAILLLGTGLAGVALKMRKRIRSNKTRQGSQ